MYIMAVCEAKQTLLIAVDPWDALEPVVTLAPQCVQIETGSPVTPKGGWKGQLLNSANKGYCT